MGRKRKGSVYKRGDTWRLALTLRDGRRYDQKCPLPPPGIPYDRAWATAVKDGILEEYEAGRWDPDQERSLAPASPTVWEWVRAYAEALGGERGKGETRRMEKYLAAHPLGKRKLIDAAPREVQAWVEGLKKQPSPKGGLLSPNYVRLLFRTLAAACRRAVFERVLSSSPCRLLPRTLSSADKTPGARAGWVFGRAEVELLLSSPEIPLYRRVQWGALFLTGLRIGELAALRWQDFDPAAKPLGKLIIAESIEHPTQKRKTTKTGHFRVVPVHPTLSALLAEWKLSGFAAQFKRAPRPEDPLTPNRFFNHLRQSTSWKNLAWDCDRLGLRRRRLHDARRTFISLAIEDGARGEVVEWITHDASKKTVRNAYTSLPYKTLCEEIAKIKVHLRGGPEVVSLPRLAVQNATDNATASAPDPTLPSDRGSSGEGELRPQRSTPWWG